MGVMDEQNGESKEEEVMRVGIGGNGGTGTRIRLTKRQRKLVSKKR